MLPRIVFFTVSYLLLLFILFIGFFIAQELEYRKKQNIELSTELEYYKTKMEEIKLHKTKLLTVTAYTPTVEECGPDPMTTASMKPVRVGAIAVSRDLFDAGWVFGKKVRIENLGIYKILDLMHPKFEESIDVFMWEKSDAMKFGKQELKVTLLEVK